MIDNWTRRTFLKAAGAAGVAGMLPVALAGGEGKAGSRVAIARAKESIGKDADVKADTVKQLVDAAITSVHETKTADEAWKGLFLPGDRVAIKVNTLAGARLSTHRSVAEAVVAGLLAAGVAGGNIVVFDRMEREMGRAGYTVGTAATGVRCTGTDSAEFGYGGRIITAGETGSLWSRIVTDFATAIVNVPVLKDHDLSGVSLGMKNFYGVIHNPNKYHDNGCDPYIADISASQYIRGKLRLVVIDALTAQADGGPAYRQDGSYAYAGVIAGGDPVAVDATGWREIETLRKDMGYKSLADAGREPVHIMTAARRGLGNCDEAKVAVTRIEV